jgi:hypothetical protein
MGFATGWPDRLRWYLGYGGKKRRGALCRPLGNEPAYYVGEKKEEKKKGLPSERVQRRLGLPSSSSSGKKDGYYCVCPCANVKGVWERGKKIKNKIKRYIASQCRGRVFALPAIALYYSIGPFVIKDVDNYPKMNSRCTTRRHPKVRNKQ